MVSFRNQNIHLNMTHLNTEMDKKALYFSQSVSTVKQLFRLKEK